VSYGAGTSVAVRPRARALAFGAFLAASLIACGPAAGGRTSVSPDPSPPSTPTAAPAPHASVWLAVLRSAPSPDALDAATERQVAVLGGALVVSPADCFAGLPPAVEGYVLGAAATSREELEGLVAETGLVPTVVLRTRSACGD
jgi:hypothetical protein